VKWGTGDRAPPEVQTTASCCFEFRPRFAFRAFALWISNVAVDVMKPPFPAP